MARVEVDGTRDPIEPLFSIIIPARNEQVMIARTLQSALEAAHAWNGGIHATTVEILVVDNDSDDATRELVSRYSERDEVRLCRWHRIGAPHARNEGARQASGHILVFCDADTLMPPETLCAIADWHRKGRFAGITRLSSLEGGFRAFVWWHFWNQVRRLPLPRAKAMPALMFCTRDVFDRLGPFDESVRLGEEWPILARCYAETPHRFVYDRSLTARSSSRRMELQRFGYSSNFLKYVWAVLHPWGRRRYTDRYRYRDATSLPD